MVYDLLGVGAVVEFMTIIFLGFNISVIQTLLSEWCVFLVDVAEWCVKESFFKFESEKVVFIVAIML